MVKPASPNGRGGTWIDARRAAEFAANADRHAVVQPALTQVLHQARHGPVVNRQLVLHRRFDLA